MEAIDDDGVDIDSLLTRIISGVMHHPAQRDIGEDGAHEGRRRIYQSMKEWWRELGQERRAEYRQKLSRDGVLNGENHKEGVHDTGHGHGCNGKLKMQKLYGQPETMEDKIAGKAAEVIIEGATSAFSDSFGGGGKKEDSGLGGILGAAGSFLSDALGENQKGDSRSRRSDDDEERPKSRHSNDYERKEYRRQDNEEESYGSSQRYQQEERRQESSSYGRGEAAEYESGGYGRGEAAEYTSGAYAQVERQQSSYGDRYGEPERQEGSYGGGGYGGSGGYGGGGGYEQSQREESGYGGSGGGYGQSQREESGYGSGGYGRSGREESSYGGGGYGREDSGYGGGYAQRSEESSYGGGYDRRE